LKTFLKGETKARKIFPHRQSPALILL